jgi:hypothetical protein
VDIGAWSLPEYVSDGVGEGVGVSVDVGLEMGLAEKVSVLVTEGEGDTDVVGDKAGCSADQCSIKVQKKLS